MKIVTFTLFIMLYSIINYGQSKVDNTIIIIKKELNYINKRINIDLKYNKKINKILVKKDIQLSFEDSNDIYKNDEIYLKLDSINHLIKSIEVIDLKNSKILENDLIKIEKKARDLSVLKKINKDSKHKIKYTSKRIEKKIKLLELKNEYYIKSILNKSELLNSLYRIEEKNWFAGYSIKNISLQNITNRDDLKNKGYQLPEEIKNNMRNNYYIEEIFQKNIDDQLKEYIPDSLFNKFQYIKEIKNNINFDTIFKPIDIHSYRVKPFTQRLKYDYNISFNKSYLNKNLIKFEYSVNYNVSDFYYLGVGLVSSLYYNRDIRQFNIGYNESYISVASGFNILNFYCELNYLNNILKLSNNKISDNNINKNQLYFGIGKRIKIGNHMTYNMYLGYNILWNHYNQESPFAFKMGFSKI